MSFTLAHREGGERLQVPGWGQSPVAETVRAAMTRPLTPRQIELVKLLALGLTMDQAAYQMGCAKNTVWNHKRDIYQKLDVSSMAQVWVSLGWLKIPDGEEVAA